MIFVTVGHATQGFRRLLDAVEAAARDVALVGEAVIVQAGHNPEFGSSRCHVEAFMPMSRFEELVRAADVLVCHGGAGTLVQVLGVGKVPVVMPRRKKYGEHVDDHQVELVAELAAQGRVVPAYEPRDVLGAITQARRRGAAGPSAPPSRLIALVAQALDELMGEAPPPRREAVAPSTGPRAR